MNIADVEVKVPSAENPKVLSFTPGVVQKIILHSLYIPGIFLSNYRLLSSINMIHFRDPLHT